MSALFTPAGPIDLFVKLRDNSTAYLGTCKEAPEVEVRPAFIDIKSDISGRTVPINKCFDGEQHLIYLTAVNHIDWLAYKFISRATTGGLGLVGQAIGGTGDTSRVDGPLDRGSLVIGSTDFELVLRYTFGGTVVAPELPVGRRYWSCVLVGARESTVGSRLMEVSMVLEANSIYSSTGSSSNGGRTFKLYTEKPDEVLSGLPVVN